MKRDPEVPYIIVMFVWLGIAVQTLFDGIPSNTMPYIFASILTIISWRLVRIDHAIRERNKEN